MGKWLQQKIQIFLTCLRAAWEVHNQCSLSNACRLTAEDRIRRIFQAVGPQRFANAWYFSIDHGLCRLWRYISNTEAGASRREDDADLPLIRETAELELETRSSIRQHQLLEHLSGPDLSSYSPRDARSDSVMTAAVNGRAGSASISVISSPGRITPPFSTTVNTPSRGIMQSPTRL